MKLTCAEPTCARPRVRQRTGDWWCSWHPDAEPPALDMRTGQLRSEHEIEKGRKRASAHLTGAAQ